MDLANDAWANLTTLYASAAPYLLPVTQRIYGQASHTYARVWPMISPFLDSLAQLATESPTVVGVGVIVVFVLVAMQVLNFARRVIVFWTRLVMRVTFWAGVVLLVSVVWRRGLGRSAEDVMDYAMQIKEVWDREYDRWEGYQNARLERNQAETTFR